MEEVFPKEMLNDYLIDRHENFTIQSAGHYAFTEYLLYKDAKYWRYWVISKDKTVMFVTYNCDEQDREQEDQIVSEIIDSIAL